MREQITYKYVPNTTEEYSQLQNFAESFEHKITPHPSVSTFAHYRGSELFGYSDHVFLPTIYPAFHPQFTRPRDVIQVMNDWRAHTQLSGKLSYIGVPIPTDKQRINFPHEIMGNLGLVRLEREVYSPQ